MLNKTRKSNVSEKTVERPAPVASVVETLEDRLCMSATTGTESMLQSSVSSTIKSIGESLTTVVRKL
jgi:hypothetical protein